MVFNKNAECIRKVINNSSSNDFFKFDKSSFNPELIKKNLQKASPKLFYLMENIKRLDDNDMSKYGKKFKHIIYSDLRSSIAGIKFVAAVFKAYGMNNIYNSSFKIDISSSNNNFALLSSVALYNKPFPIRLRNDIIKTFNQRPDNIYGEKIRYLLLDQGFKEGIDVYDVKYVHLFDDLITPSDQKQAIGRGTRFCGQKGLEFNPELGWPLHVFKYKLDLNKDFVDLYDTDDAFMMFIKESKIDINKLYFAAELENICRFGAVDYEINKAIHEFGNEKEDNLDKKEIYSQYQRLMDFKIKDLYDSFENNEEYEFKLLKKAYQNFGGKVVNKLINKKTKRFINIKKVKSIGLNLSRKLGFIDMRKYVRRYFNNLKWANLQFKNNCVLPPTNDEDKKDDGRIIELNNSQKFVSEYFTSKSPYKGILLWHSVGTGKTCTAIATASNSFENDGYTILWVTRHTLKPDIWKNIFTQVCSKTIKEKLMKGENIPLNPPSNQLKYLDNKWVIPISYKQFSNLISGKNVLYKELVGRNGRSDPLQKTLIIIDEAHKIFSPDVPATEKPNVNVLKKAIYHSYKYSGVNSCKLILMTATPYTNDPIQLFKLLNLLKEDNYFDESFDKFKNKYLDDNYKFLKDKNREFLDDISGYISYLNREKDARQFAYPVIYTERIPMSLSDILPTTYYDDYLSIKDEINSLIDTDLDKSKELINNLKTIIKEHKNQLKKVKTSKDDVLSQETALLECIKKKDDKKVDKKIDDKLNEIDDFIKDITNHIKDTEKELAKKQKQEEKELAKKQKQEEKELAKKPKQEEKELAIKPKQEDSDFD